MSQLSNITLPDGSTYNLKGSVYCVIGTQTATTGSWTGNLTSLDALYTGLTIAYYLPYAGSGNATLNLTLKNGGTGAINCYYQTGTRMTTHYPAGSVIWMTYFAAGDITVAGTATTDNRWIGHSNYYSDTHVYEQAYSSTAAATAAKTASCTYYQLNNKSYVMLEMQTDNTAASALTLNIDNKGAKPVYINGEPSSATNYTWPHGSYMTYYEDGIYYIRTDGLLPTGGVMISNKVSLQYNSTTQALDFVFS